MMVTAVEKGEEVNCGLEGSEVVEVICSDLPNDIIEIRIAGLVIKNEIFL